MALILAAILICQVPPSGPHQTAVTELAFVGAVEDFVLKADPLARPPEPARGYFARMASLEWRERDRATRGAEAYFAANPGEVRWLFVGRRSRDPEVAVRANVVIKLLNPCSTCKGEGTSRNQEAWPCWDCQGTKTRWPYSAFD
jgi:hypothetical protein